YLRKTALEHGSPFRYVYVLNGEGQLVGVVALRDVFTAPRGTPVSEVMRREVVCVDEHMHLRAVRALMKEHRLLALPVVDPERRLKGLIGLTQIVDALEEEATREMQKVGGVEALGEPYLRIGILSMIRKRAGWLSALFLGEMLTATAMGHFEHEI